jgi:7,8-dihydropterin-6-yl-methyl-4-(beta-D-ribofuranosyl)aminobenzene 5'-phosphate synthase
MELGDKLEEYAKRLSEMNTYFYTCHCTGKEQFEFMREFARNIKYISSGDVFEIQGGI